MVSTDFSNPMGGQEFYFQVVCGSCSLKAIKGWSSKNHIIRWRAIDNEKVYHPCHLSRVSPSCNLQWNDAFWINMVSTETGQRESEGSEAFWIQLHLLESRHVHYICRASVIHQHSSGVVMVSIMTRGSLWGCLIPFTSRSKKTALSFPIRWCFAIGCLIWTLFTCFWTAFLQDWYDPPTTGPPMIVLISPTICLGLSQSSSLWSLIDFSFIC